MVNSQRTRPFTLPQKIFAVRHFYKGGGDLQQLMDTMYLHYHLQCNAFNARAISDIIAHFEALGTVQGDFEYCTVFEEPHTDPLDSQDDSQPSSFSFEIESPGNSPDPSNLPRHQRPEPVYGCVLCRKPVRKSMYRKHLRYHAKKNETGGKTIDELERLPKPKPEEKIPSEATTACGICQKKVSNKNLEKHVKNHSKPPPTTCGTCGLSFPSVELRQRHQRTTHKPQLMCEFCGKVMTSRQNHKDHLATHATEKNFVCSICHSSFSGLKTLKRHEVVHQPKRHECDYCPLKFARKTGLKRHLLTHTKEKPYICQICGAAFAAHMTHQMHMRLHTGERPYSCKHCGENFIGLPSLNNHLKTHEGEYTFHCSLCVSRFKTEKTLREHIQKKHNCEIIVTTEGIHLEGEHEIMEEEEDDDQPLITFNAVVV